MLYFIDISIYIKYIMWKINLLNMLIVEVEGKLNIEKALKVLKRKWDKTKAIKELRERKEFTKKSVKRRDELKRAVYIQNKYRNND